jgi:hypothetical protein
VLADLRGATIDAIQIPAKSASTSKRPKLERLRTSRINDLSVNETS